MSWGHAHALPRDRIVEVTSSLLYSPPFLITRPSDDLCEGFAEMSLTQSDSSRTIACASIRHQHTAIMTYCRC